MRYSIIFVILIAVSSIMIEDSMARYPLWFSIFFNTLMTVVIFNLMCIKKIKETYAACVKYKGVALRMMLFTLLIYTLCFFSTEMVGASNYNSFYFAGSALLGYWFLKAEREKRRVNVRMSVVLLILCVAYGAYLCFSARSVTTCSLGILWAVTGSVSGYFYAVDSSRFAQLAGTSANQILALRFDLLLLFSLFMLPKDTMQLVNSRSMLYMFVLALTGTALPVYFLQRGINVIGAEVNGIIVAFIPFLTMILSVIFYRVFDLNESGFVIILTALLILPLFPYGKIKRCKFVNRNGKLL